MTDNDQRVSFTADTRRGPVRVRIGDALIEAHSVEVRRVPKDDYDRSLLLLDDEVTTTEYEVVLRIRPEESGEAFRVVTRP